jgi:hypothetical protein
MTTAETHPPARTLLVVRTGASVDEMSDAAHLRSIALNQILATGWVLVNPRNIRTVAPITLAGLSNGRYSEAEGSRKRILPH